MSHSNKVASVRYLGEVNILFICMYKFSSCSQQYKYYKMERVFQSYDHRHTAKSGSECIYTVIRQRGSTFVIITLEKQTRFL